MRDFDFSDADVVRVTTHINAGTHGVLTPATVERQMHPITKQSVVLSGLIAGCGSGLYLGWLNVSGFDVKGDYLGSAYSEKLGSFDLLLAAPTLALFSSVTGLVTASMLSLVLNAFGGSTEKLGQSRSLKLLTRLSLLACVAGLSFGLLILRVPTYGLWYGVKIAVWQEQAAEAEIDRVLELPDREAALALRDLIRDGEPFVKRRAADALCDLGDASNIALDDMLDLVLGKHGTRFGGFRAGRYSMFLANRGPAAAPLVPRLARVLLEPPGIDKSEWYRLELIEFAVNTLGGIGPDAIAALPALEQVAMQYERWGLEDSSVNYDRDDPCRIAAVRALESIGADCDVFRRLLASKYSDTRREASQILQLKCGH